MMEDNPRLVEEAVRLNSETRGELDVITSTSNEVGGPPPSIREHPPAGTAGGEAIGTPGEVRGGGLIAATRETTLSNTSSTVRFKISLN